jgi:hypothetical protein
VKVALAFIASFLIAASCQITCKDMPVHTEILVLPIRVEPTPGPTPDYCKSEREYIDALLYRLNFEYYDPRW